MLIHTQRATTYSMCFISPRYRVLLFLRVEAVLVLYLVWEQYWKTVASALFRLFLSSNGIESTSLRTLDFSICSYP